MYNTPAEVAKLYTSSATEKTRLPFLKFALLAVLGGAFIALGGLLTVVVAGGSPSLMAANPGLTKFLSGALFPVGLMLVGRHFDDATLFRVAQTVHQKLD